MREEESEAWPLGRVLTARAMQKNDGNDVAPRKPGKFQTRTKFGSSTVEQALLLASLAHSPAMLPLPGGRISSSQVELCLC